MWLSTGSPQETSMPLTIKRPALPSDDKRWRIERSAVLSSFHYHYARLIEILFAQEHIQEYLEDPIITKKQAKYSASLNNLEGVGCCEAPRGTLIHHYRVDEQGLITFANLIIATGHK